MNILALIYFFLPAAFANMAPPIAAKLLGPGRPVDGGRQWRGKPIFGKNKTWQGLASATLLGGVVFMIQVSLSDTLPSLSVIDYAAAPIWLGFLMGLGAILGDLIESGWKRRLGVASGRPFMPFDQTDFVIGGLLFVQPFARLYLLEWLALLASYFILHIAASLLGYSLGFKKDPL